MELPDVSQLSENYFPLPPFPSFSSALFDDTENFNALYNSADNLREAVEERRLPSPCSSFDTISGDLQELSSLFSEAASVLYPKDKELGPDELLLPLDISSTFDAILEPDASRNVAVKGMGDIDSHSKNDVQQPYHSSHEFEEIREDAVFDDLLAVLGSAIDGQTLTSVFDDRQDQDTGATSKVQENCQGRNLPHHPTIPTPTFEVAPKSYYDVIFKVGEETFQSNRQVIASKAPSFLEIFRNFGEASEIEITLGGYDPADVKCLIDFVNGGAVKIADDRLVYFLQTSANLQFNGVVEECLNHLKRESPSKVLTARACPVIAQNPKWKEELDNYILRNFNDIWRSQAFLELPYSVLNDFIGRSELKVKSEKTLLDAVISWVKASVTDRHVKLPQLLRRVRMPLLTCSDLSSLQLFEEIIRSSVPCCKLVDRAKMQKLSMERDWSVPKRKRARLHGCKAMDYGVFSVCRTKNDLISVYYYNIEQKSWKILCADVFTGDYNYVVSKEKRMYFIGTKGIVTLHLRTRQDQRFVSKITQCQIVKDYTPLGAAITLYNGRIYFFGSSFFSHAAKIHHLEPESGRCVYVGDIQDKRADPGAVVLKGCIYITGGYNLATALSSVEAYNPATGQTIPITPMLSRRYRHGCTTHRDKIYVCGGCSPGELIGPFTSTAEVYCPVADQWQYIAKMGSARSCMSFFALIRKLYAVDVDPDDESDFNVEIYDPEDNKWSCRGFIPFLKEKDLNIVFTNSASRLWGRD